MELDIHSGKRVLYKRDGQWHVGTLTEAHNTVLTQKGLYLTIIPIEFGDKNWTEVPFVHDAEINDIFLDAMPLDDYLKDYSDIFMTKEEYIDFIENDDSFVKSAEQAYVSDGEYYYYKINKFNRSWIEKQPFDYIVRLG